MKTVLIRASGLTMSGYGTHARQVLRWAFEKEKTGQVKVFTQLLPWGDTPWCLDQTRFDGIVGEAMKRAAPMQGKADVSIQLQLPNEWDASIAKFNVGMTAAVETDKCNPEWINCCNKMNLVIVPSVHTKKTLESSGNVTVPIVVIPESFPDVFLEDKTVELNLKLDTSFNFLLFGQFTGNNPENDRKNIFYTLKWMCEVFKDSKDVGIIIKTNSGRNTRIDRNVCKNILERLLAEVRMGGKSPPVYLVHGDLEDVEVFSLMKHPSVKATVNLTRGEGFGLPILEAAVAEVPVIATNWSAHTEFLNQGKWIQVDYNLFPIHESRVDNRIFMQGTRWANPIEDNFKKRIKKFYESPSIPQQWARDLSKSLKETHNFQKISTLYDVALGDFLK